MAKHRPNVAGRLAGRETILINCRGGRGRAGMVAARLMVEMGMPPETAITLVRAERAEAIETREPEVHIRTCEAVAATQRNEVTKQ